MQLFILVVINIFMGALLYLVISLKLEKSASEFREKKLRREMDEIIKEFNAAADRNIAILENRISVMKRLLSRSGDMSCLDITVGDESPVDMAENKEGETTVPRPLPEKVRNEAFDLSGEIPLKSAGERVSRTGDAVPDLKKSLLILFRNVIDTLTDKKNNLLEAFVKGRTQNGIAGKTVAPLEVKEDATIRAGRVDSLIEKDMAVFSGSLAQGGRVSDAADVPGVPACDDNAEQEMDEEDVLRLFSESKDKYGLVGELYGMGFSMERISHLSGMPVGEIKLVLNLRRS